MEQITYFQKLNTLNEFLTLVFNEQKSHAYLLISEDNVTARMASKMFALHFACKNKQNGRPCYSCSDCVKILNNTSIDVFIYPKKGNIVVEDIKEIVSSVQVKPLELKNKIYILNDCEKSTIAAQNKLLKTLEEPPQNVIFILTASSEKTVLPTIASRVKTIVLKKPTKEEIKEILRQISSDEKKINIATENSNSNLGKALSLIDDEVYFEIYNFCLDLIGKMNTSKQVLPYASEMEKNKRYIGTYLEILSGMFRDMLILKDNLEELVFNKASLNLLKFANQNYSKIALIKILEKINDSNKMLRFNVNSMGIIDVLLLGILEVKYKWKTE